MPTYPSRLHLEPFIEVIQTPNTIVTPNLRTIQSVQSYPNSVAVTFGFNLFFIYFQMLGISKLSSESSSTGQTIKSAQLQAPHHHHQRKFLPLQDKKSQTDHLTMALRSHTSHRDQNNPTERAI